MNLFTSLFLARHRLKLLFVLIWLHISLLDLFYITYHGPVFLWLENSQPRTLLVHVTIALASIVCYLLAEKLQSAFRSNK